MVKRDDWWQEPRVVFNPQVHQGMLRGIEQIVNAVRPTLGPFPRLVLYDKSVTSSSPPEFLDDAGTIARRVIQIKGRDADVGAMLVRHMLWTLREEVGDGTATAAVLFDSLYRSGLRYLAAGANPMRLRPHLEAGLREILTKLDEMSRPVEGKQQLARLAEVVSQDPELGRMLGEIFDIIGPYGRLEIRKGHSRHYEREYVEGMYWDTGLLSRAFIVDTTRQRVEMENPFILMCDLEIEDPHELVPVFALCVREGIKDLVIVTRKMSETLIGMLVYNRERKKLDVNIIGVKTPGVSVTDQRVALMDMAVLTGGRPFFRDAQDRLRTVKLADLGRARRIWAERGHFGIIGGGGDPRKLREHIAQLRALHANTTDLEERERVQARIGKLLGGSATLYVGGTTETELGYNKEWAKRVADAMRGALREGVVPGGGVALFACRADLLEKAAQSEEFEAQAAYKMLAEAVEMPMRVLLENAGYVPSEALSRLHRLGPSSGLDVRTGEVVDMWEAGILDITTVVKAAVRGAVSTAALALTTDVLVHRAAAPQALNT